MQLQACCDEFLRTAAHEEDSRNDIVHEIVDKIQRNQSNLLQLVSCLGEFLTQTDSTIRHKSMSLLQKVLSTMSKDTLSGQHITVMTAFFCDRLTDEVCLGECLAALSAISQMRLFTREDAETAATRLLEKMQDSTSLPQRVKFQIYTLLERIMAHHRAALRNLGNKFVEGFSDFMSGEKDPRNLMLAFSIMRVILAEFEIKSQASDLFDVVYCYFPITFRPPPDEPSTITTEDLKGRLRDCLCASPEFAPYLIPALEEKLNAIAVSVKKDTLLTLQQCCTSYSAEILDIYANTLWAALKYEIIQSEDSLMEELALNVLTSMTICFCQDLGEMPKAGPLARWLHPIVVECLQQLREPELKSAKPCGKILHGVAVASSVCLSIVLRAVLPGLVAICQESTAASKSTTLLEVLLNLLTAALERHDSPSASNASEFMAELEIQREALLAVLYSALLGQAKEELQLRQTSIKCLVHVAKLRHFLKTQELRSIAAHFTTIVLEEKGEMCDSALEALEELSEIEPNLILESTFPALLAQLPDEHDLRSTSTTTLALGAMAKLSGRKDIMNCLIVRILSRIEMCLRHDSNALEYLVQLLTSLSQALKLYDKTEAQAAAQFFDKLVPPLYQLTFKYRSTSMTSPSVLKILGEIVNLICRQCTKEKQERLMEDLQSLFLTGRQNTLTQRIEVDFAPFDLEATSDEAIRLLTLLIYPYAAMRRDIESVAQLDRDLISKLIGIIQWSKDETHRKLLCEFLALLINKSAADAEISEMLADLQQKINLQCVEHIDVTIAIAKALILRSHKDGTAVVSGIVPLLESSDSGLSVAHKFQAMLVDDFLLIPRNFAFVKRLYKQKFYAHIVPVMTRMLQECQQDAKANYLIVLSIVISHTPQAIYASEFNEVLPILLQCISLKDTNARRTAIITIDHIAYEQKDAISSHLSTLIPSLLSCTEQSTFSPPRTRIASLHLLGTLVDIVRTDKLLPFKTKVIRVLAASIDDPKRLVRKEAVLTRQKYFVSA